MARGIRLKPQVVNFADLPVHLSIPDAGAILGLTRSSAYRAAKRGQIPTVRIGREDRVPRGGLAGLCGETVNPAPSDSEQPEKAAA